MKIVFLQQVSDAMGGAVMVNCSLARQFLVHEHEVTFLSIRKSGKKNTVPYPLNAELRLINDRTIWDVPRLNVMKDHFLKGDFTCAMKQLKKRRNYDKELQYDFEVCRKTIEELAPDFIICSHYECLEGIPSDYLKVTINHYHTTFTQVLKSSSQVRFLNRYKDKIGRFLWLSNATSNEAKKAGYSNSSFIYNPISFLSDTVSDVANSRKVVFVGRFSEEKRVPLLVRLFDETIKEYQIKGWELSIVGYGELDNETMSVIDSRTYINLYPPTSDVKSLYLKSALLCLTSSFEGLALVIIEAAECGVPSIAFEFSESIAEEIQNGVTGVVVAQDQFKEYKKQLAELIIHENKRVQMGQEAKVFATKFHQETIYEEWMNLFKEMRDVA